MNVDITVSGKCLKIAVNHGYRNGEVGGPWCKVNPNWLSKTVLQKLKDIFKDDWGNTHDTTS